MTPPLPRRIIVGLSGGPDSTALLAFLCRQGCECVAAIVNYALRGDESDRDEAHARDVAARLGAKAIEVLHADVAAEMKARGGSVEMACRRLRYEWMEALRLKYCADAIATGHHRDDADETFFLNLMRGTGIAGLRGIAPINGHIIRPLIDMSRADISRILRDAGLTGMTDSTNLGDDYLRNRVRHHVIPALRDASPSAMQGLHTTMRHLDEQHHLLGTLLDAEQKRIRRDDGAFDIAAIARHPMAAALAFALLERHGFNRATTDSIVAAAASSHPLRFADNAGRRYLLHRGMLRPEDTGDATATAEAGRLPDLPLCVARISRDDFRPGDGALYLDAEADTEAHWELGPRRRGDRLEPFGMADGSRLVSDIIHDAGIPADRRHAVMTLRRNGTILWVVGLRTSRHFAVTPSTRAILRITLPAH